MNRVHRLIFDIEADNLLDKITKVHCIVTKDVDTGEVRAYSSLSSEPIEVGLMMLEIADVLIGHNIQGYDIPALKKLYPRFSPKAKLLDTLICSRLIWPELKRQDFAHAARNKDFPKQLIGRHSLEAWGHRLKVHKGEYKAGWETFSQEMLDYCTLDVTGPTSALFELIEKKNYSQRAIDLEHAVCLILERQMKNGVGFNRKAAVELLAELTKKRNALAVQLESAFKPFVITKTFTPKRDNKTLGYKKDVPFTKVTELPFSPGSRQHIGRAMVEQRGWKPENFTATGLPVVEEGSFAGFDAPEVPLIEEFLLLEKRIGQLADGKQGWLRVEKDGVIHGRIDHNGAVTGRCTHSQPNLSAVPRVGKPYGRECRALFGPTRPGWGIVGADASGLELRCLAHYLHKYDGGAFVKILLEGDVHSLNASALAIDRDKAKTFIYAWLYGAGDEKIGLIVGLRGDEARATGKRLKKKFLKQFPALGHLLRAVGAAVERRYVVGLDGRHIPIRSQHAALNTLLQGMGAAVMKTALVILDAELRRTGLAPGADYEFMLNVHDEWQIEAPKCLLEPIGQAAVKSIIRAGELLGVRCPLNGEYKTGLTWADTH